MSEQNHQFLKIIASDLPVSAEKPDTAPPINPVIKTSINGELFFKTIIEILLARI